VGAAFPLAFRFFAQSLATFWRVLTCEQFGPRRAIRTLLSNVIHLIRSKAAANPISFSFTALADFAKFLFECTACSVCQKKKVIKEVNFSTHSSPLKFENFRVFFCGMCELGRHFEFGA